MNSSANGSTALLPAALGGVRVVSIALNLPGPACARRLADFGATVIKIEPPAVLGGDPMREYARGYYDELHRGMEIHALNLKTDDGRLALDGLLATADVLITSQRDAALDRLSLGWDALSARFPRLCQVAIVGSVAGNDAGHDLTYIAAAGLATPPHMPATLIADLAGAERAVSATFAALRLLQQSGCGHRMLVSLATAAHAFAGPHTHGLTRAGGLLSGGHPGYNFYPARDGWVVLAALEPHFAARVQAASQVEFTPAALTEYFRQHDVRHWAAWAEQHDIPLATLPSLSTPSE
jgi:crotonobetainyl-CoA:carnitine CoA-transferase CaiB-like acyl-CoA transferase